MTERNHDEDDPLGFELDAWEVPPPRGGTADAVIATLHNTHGAVAAVDGASEGRRPRRRAWLVGGGAAVVAVASIIAIGAWGMMRAPSNGRPEAAPPEPLLVGGSPSQVAALEERVATLEAQLAVEQRRREHAEAAASAADKPAQQAPVDPFARSRDTTAPRKTARDTVLDPFGNRRAGPARDASESDADEERYDPFESPRGGTLLPCDADKLQAKGDQQFTQGAYAHALATFERAAKCRPEPSTYLRAFMSACSARNVGRARAHYAELSADQQSQAVSVCVRQGISHEQLTRAAPSDLGELRIVGNLGTRVEVDGVDVGISPLTLALPAGKHKVTFTIGTDRHTFAVVVEAGESTTFAKEL